MMSMRLILTAALAASLMSPLAASAQSGGAPEPEKQTAPTPMQPKVFPQNITWTAIEVNGRSFASDRPSFLLDSNFRARGYGGCNTFSATAYPLKEQGIAVGPMAVTKRACDKGRMELERVFLLALRSSQKWNVSEGILTLEGQSGRIRFQSAL